MRSMPACPSVKLLRKKYKHARNNKDFRDLPVFVVVGPMWIKLTLLKFMFYERKGNMLKRG